MSGERGTIRKIYDKIPASITSNGSFDGSGAPTTAWAAGLLTPASGTTLWLTDISESVNDNGRVGISVAAESLDLRVRITPQPSVIGYQHLRMIVVADNECDGAAPAITDLLGDTSGAATTVATGVELSFLQPAYFGRFSIIEDKNWILYSSSTANTFTETQPHCLLHEAHHDLKGHRIMWDTSDSSNIANARKGHIFMFFIYSNMVTAAGGLPTLTVANPPTISYTSRLRYRDA